MRLLLFHVHDVIFLIQRGGSVCGHDRFRLGLCFSFISFSSCRHRHIPPLSLSLSRKRAWLFLREREKRDREERERGTY